MAESLEHKWLGQNFLNTLTRFSSTGLYTIREAERKKFDFACLMASDYERSLVGQTLWGHAEGVDKDLRTLVSASESAVWAYVLPDSMRVRTLVYGVVRDLQQSKYGADLFRLKLFWVPADFEAGTPTQEEVVRKILQESIVDDVLMNVVFGRLSAEDVRVFLKDYGIPGLNMAVLLQVASDGFHGFAKLGDDLRMSPSTLRPRYPAVLGSGFIFEPSSPDKAGASALVSQKGRVFIRLCARLYLEYRDGKHSPEIQFLMKKLGLVRPPAQVPRMGDPEWNRIVNSPPSEQKYYQLLIGMIEEARAEFNRDVDMSNFRLSGLETHSPFDIVR